MQPKYAFKWRMDGSEGVQWYIMGIRPDGRFYGEITDWQARRGTSVEGEVPDWPRTGRSFGSSGAARRLSRSRASRGSGDSPPMSGRA